jgi:hypothetical protein
VTAFGGAGYQYSLEGTDADWCMPSDTQAVRYTNFAPGHYRIAVRSVTESSQVSAGRPLSHFKFGPSSGGGVGSLGLVMLAAMSIAVSLHR